MNCIIIDYGMGNLRSIQHKLGKINIDAQISSSLDDIQKAQFLVLPGVGYFAKGMDNIKRFGLFDILNQKVIEEKTPILGICLGMQLFSKHSEEGNAEGLGWIDAEAKLLRFNNNNYKVPHIGWGTLKPKRKSPILVGVEPDQRFYFVHSYHVVCYNSKDILTTTLYGDQEFVSSIHRGNIFGTQFHPEKSHRRGMKLITNFYYYSQ